MRIRNHAHLLEEQVIWAVIDEEDLADDDRQHLLECSVCLRKVEQFRDELQALEQKARQAVPPITRPVRLPDKKPVRNSQNIGWLPFFGTAAMAGLLIFFYFMGLESRVSLEQTTLQSQQYLLEDEALMRQIAEMVEDPLPDDMYEISGEDEFGFDENFLQFVVPDIQDDFQSELFFQGGIKRC